MAVSPAFNPVVKMIEKNGSTFYTISFKAAGMMGLTEDAEEIQHEKVPGSGQYEVVKVVKGDGEFYNTFTFERKAVDEKKVPVKYHVKIMKNWYDCNVVFTGEKVEVKKAEPAPKPEPDDKPALKPVPSNIDVRPAVKLASSNSNAKSAVNKSNVAKTVDSQNMAAGISMLLAGLAGLYITRRKLKKDR